MKYFVRRRLQYGAVTILAVTLIALMVRGQKAANQHDSFTTGYLLLAAIVFLAMYSLRKKLPVLPLGNASAWLQLHIYVGFATIFVFLLHIGMRVPNGRFESVLAAVFTAVVSSGILGLYLTRTIPRKIARLPEEYVFERIPRLRHQVSMNAREVAMATLQPSTSQVVATFYVDELASFFERPREVLFHLFPGSRRRRQLMGKLADVQRYCSEPERQASEQLFSLIRRKDDLDYHFAQQLILKTWLFIHVGMTYSLLVLAFLHAAMAHAFRGTV